MTAAVLEDTTWKADAMAVLKEVARTGDDFDAYTLETNHGVRRPPHPNMWGDLFRTAYRRDIITPIGFHQSERPGRAGGVCRVWRGLPDETYERAAA